MALRRFGILILGKLPAFDGDGGGSRLVLWRFGRASGGSPRSLTERNDGRGTGYGFFGLRGAPGMAPRH